ncbi:MAG: TrbI/VirB10 family protein [Alphaproteobacteria bacterium]|nr:TrbI/VirB10 family protein [Alphaproteobacteria bacterium]
MTNDFENNDDFVEPEIGAPNEPRNKPSAMGNLAEAWRTKPVFKLVILIAGVFAIGASALNFFGGNKTPTETAHLAAPPALKEAPGGVVSPYMRQQTELANAERAKKALESGGSAIPTPVGQTQNGPASFDMQDDRGSAALRELRAETELLKRQIKIQQQQQEQKKTQKSIVSQQELVQQRQIQEQQDNSLAEAMQRQMQQLLTSWAPMGIKNVAVVGQGLWGGAMPSGDAAGIPAGTSAGSFQSAFSDRKKRKAFIKAGTVNYAQLLTEANSDVPGPILAQIVSGPLTGARAVGSFQVSDGYEKYIVMRFSLANKNGRDYSIDAIALDPDTTLGGMATEVDERYFTRVILPAAAGFLQGMGEAMSEGGSSITSSGDVSITTQSSQGSKEGIYRGLSRGAQTMSQFFQQRANVTKPLVRVDAGTPFGLFFVSSVFDGSTNALGEETVPSTSEENPSKVTTSGAVSVTKSDDKSVDWNTTVPYPNYAGSGSGTATKTSPYRSK